MTDTLHRAGKSSAQLARLLSGAAQCCRDEKEVIEEGEEALETRIDVAGFQWAAPS